jgi:periplasmic protein TonB
VKVIQKGPAWVPAVQNGRSVNAYRKQPITFRVTNE